MARGMGKVQKTIKALVSKRFAAELRASKEPHQWHDTHMGWGLAGASLALILGAVAVIVPTVIAARIMLTTGGVLWFLAMLVMCRDAKARLTRSVIFSVPLMIGVAYLWRYHDPPPDLVASLARIEAMVKDIHGFILSPKTRGSDTPTQPAARKTDPHPSFNVALALIPTIHRMREPGGRGYLKGGQNDLIGILRVQQHNGVAVRHVRSLQVVGRIPADFNSYMAFFSKGDGTESMDSLEAAYIKRRPFFRLSWIIFPASPFRIDPTDDEFAKFTISHSMGATAFPMFDPRSGSPRDAFGFEDAGKEPKYLMTNPVWSQLIRFTDTNPSDLTGRQPVLRDEVKSGKLILRADIDGEIIDIPTKNIKLPWSVPFEDQQLENRSLPDLFNGIDDGLRNTPGSATDPLISPRAEPAPEKPLTLRDLFLSDFATLLKMHPNDDITVNKSDGTTVRLAYQIYYDVDAKAKFIGFFIPSADSDIFNICVFLAREAPKLIDRFETAGGPVGQMINQKDLIFTGLVYIYNEPDLSITQRAALLEIYHRQKLDIQFRDLGYLAMQNLARRTDAK